MSLISRIMGTKKTVSKKVVTKKDTKSVSCTNCEDSGLECSVCGAGKEITDIV